MPKGPASIRRKQLVISAPQDFEHFLHVGAENLRDVNELCKDTVATFQEVVQRRSRQLPQTPSTPVTQMDRHQQPAVSLTATPKGMAGTPSSSRVSKKGGGQLRSYLLGEQTPKKKREKAERREYVQYTIDCISQGNLEELNGILEGGAVDVNAVDDDGHTLLDLAVILNQFACAHLLQLFGGAETEAYADPSVRARRLEVQLRAKQIALGNILDEIKGGNKHLQKEHDRARQVCEVAENFYRRWNVAFRAAKKPSPPKEIGLLTASPTSLLVTLGEASDHNGAVVTRCAIEWSETPDFANPSRVFCPSVTEEYLLEGLPTGRPCYVRVAACNMVGTGPPTSSQPPFLVPSSWREVENKRDRIADFQLAVSGISQSAVDSRPAGVGKGVLVGPITLAKGGAGKLIKTMRRGLHLAVVVSSETDGRILTVGGGSLPLVLLDPVLGDDLADKVKWLQKLSLDWRVAHTMNDLDHDVAIFPFRKRVALIIRKLQSLLGVTDLGIIHAEPFREPNGALVLEAITRVDPKSVKAGVGSGLSWDTAEKVAQKAPDLGAEVLESYPHGVASSIAQSVTLTGAATTPLSPGLYLAACLPESTLKGVRILVQPASNTLPCVKVRHTSAISRPEWEYLRATTNQARSGTSTHGSQLQRQIVAAAAKLIEKIGVDADIGSQYRLYDQEVIDVSAKVSFLLLLPPQSHFLAETVGSAGASGLFNGCTSISVNTFEHALWLTYQRDSVKQYARLYLYLANLVPLITFKKRSAMASDVAMQLENDAAKASGQDSQLSSSWGELQWLNHIFQWGRGKTDAGQDAGHTLAHMKKNVKVMPATPGEPGSTSPATGRLDASRQVMPGRRRLATNVMGAGKLKVFIEDPGQAQLSNHVDLLVTQTTTAESVVEKLQAQLDTAEGIEYVLYIRSADGDEKRVAADCRPLLMQSRWESKESVLVLRHDVPEEGVAV